jgi:3-oxoacyl-[acyl-carrier protein] reductase
MDYSFKNMQVFITGTSRGIGRAISQKFHSEGALVIEPTRDEMDLDNSEHVETYLSAVNCHPSIIILNAAVNIKLPLEEISKHDFFCTFQTNLFSSIEIIKRFAPSMKKRKYGRIIFLSSLYAIISKENRILYSSSKNAITGLVKTLTLELAPYNILVNAVAPGYVLTEMTKKNLTPIEMNEITEAIPLKRLQTENEVADLILFLSSNYNQSITGQLIAVDGGYLSK